MDVRTSFLSLAATIGIAGGGCVVALGPAYRQGLREAEPHRPPIRLDDTVALGEATLDRQALITAVLARSPDVEAARAAWRAALAKVPQATAAEDPMVAYQIAPLSVVGDAPFGQVVRVEQRLPVPGQRALAGDVALAEADAVRGDEADVRLRLALMASNTFDDYYLVERALEINRHHRELMAGIREAAAGQYAAGKTSQQDPIQADSELARIDLERIQLEADRQVVVAQLNGLLHRDLDAALPPSPPRLAIPEVQVQGGDLDAVAVRDRPELRGVEAQARRGEAARRLAVRSRWPVVSVMGEYNGMWDTPEHRWMLGVSISVPLQGAVRRGAEAEAIATIDRASLLREQLVDQIGVEVSTARDRLDAARRSLTLYDMRLVPTAQARVDAALTGYVADQNEFQAVIEAEHDRSDALLERERALCDIYRRAADLDRALGRVPGTGGNP